MRHDPGSAIQPPLTRVERQWLSAWGTLPEGQARLLAAQKALELGRGGVSRVALITGLSRTTVSQGISDLRNPGAIQRLRDGRSRRKGGGRKRSESVAPGLRRTLERVLEESTAGDPMGALKWTNLSTRLIAGELAKRGYRISAVTVGRYVTELGYSLQLNVKALEGSQHVDRERQFQHINKVVTEYLATGDPVVSVDTKKRELVGQFKNAGRTLRPRGQPRKVNTSDYPDQADGVAIPFGTYDVGRNAALVNVGTTYDTSDFAVESIRRWWAMLGKPTYPKATRLLICADGGGSNGSRRRLWKLRLQDLASELGIPVSVCHYPPGTSKWNKIEHRLFSFISLNWQGKPLVDYETVVQLIGNTRTKTGLRVSALLDTNQYQRGIEVSDEQMANIRLNPDLELPAWNYTIMPTRSAMKTDGDGNSEPL